MTIVILVLAVLALTSTGALWRQQRALERREESLSTLLWDVAKAFERAQQVHQAAHRHQQRDHAAAALELDRRLVRIEKRRLRIERAIREREARGGRTSPEDRMEANWVVVNGVRRRINDGGE